MGISAQAVRFPSPAPGCVAVSAPGCVALSAGLVPCREQPAAPQAPAEQDAGRVREVGQKPRVSVKCGDTLCTGLLKRLCSLPCSISHGLHFDDGVP